MARKLVNISLVLILLTGTIGLSISKHYCGGMLMAVAINSPADGCGDSEMPMACCTDDTHLYAIDDDFQLNQQTFQFQTPSVVLHEIGLVISTDLVVFERTNKYNIDPPPLEPEQDIYIRVQSFLL